MANVNVTKYEEEKELVPLYKPEDNIYIRTGFTQGSPLSPLMAIAALEFAGFGDIENLSMFADDGIVLSRNEIDIKKEIEGRKIGDQMSGVIGLKVAEDKPYGHTNYAKFLGIEIDMKERKIGRIYEDKTEE